MSSVTQRTEDDAGALRGACRSTLPEPLTSPSVLLRQPGRPGDIICHKGALFSRQLRETLINACEEARESELDGKTTPLLSQIKGLCGNFKYNPVSESRCLWPELPGLTATVSPSVARGGEARLFSGATHPAEQGLAPEAVWRQNSCHRRCRLLFSHFQTSWAHASCRLPQVHRTPAPTAVGCSCVVLTRSKS